VASWLPTASPSHALDELDWWRPTRLEARLGKKYARSSYRYIVVDELEKEVAELVVSPWPRVDPAGRLHFGAEEASTCVTVDQAEFSRLLERERRPVVRGRLARDRKKALLERKLAIGDVFAARVSPRFGRYTADPAEWIRGQVYDITAVARTVAKGQTSAALAGLLERSHFDAIADELMTDRERAASRERERALEREDDGRDS
jgi:hypothetical protein